MTGEGGIWNSVISSEGEVGTCSLPPIAGTRP